MIQGWKYKDENEAPVLEALEKELQRYLDPTTGEMEECIRNACEKTVIAKNTNDGHYPLYWWNQEIADKRWTCVTTKRKATRANKRNIPEEEKAEMT